MTLEYYFTCEHCGKKGLPSVWILIYKNGRKVYLITECANDLRHKYGDGPNMTIVEPIYASS